MEKTPKKNSSRLQLVIAAMILAALFLAELYVMINESNNMVLLIGIAVLILIALYFVIDAVMDCINERNIVNMEQYDTIFRSEKASYKLLKKNLDEISKQVKSLNVDTNKEDKSVAEIVKSQKTVAKVAMAKSKETQDRLFIELNNLEASLNDRIHGLSEKLSGFQEEIERLADHIAKINEEAIKEASQNIQTVRTVVAETPVMPEIPVMEDIPLDFEDSVMEEPISEESAEEAFFEDTLSLDDFAVEEKSVLEDSISDIEEATEELDFGNLELGELDLDAASPVESDDDILSQLLAAETTPVEEVDALAELAKAVDETPAPAPTPTPADNGGKMGQDDIAALIASMTGGDAAPTPEPEPAPAPVPTPAPADNGGKMGQDDIAALIASMTGGDAAPAAEPAPAPTPVAPVDDNPNRMMTPEEIAALIAGTNN